MNRCRKCRWTVNSCDACRRKRNRRDRARRQRHARLGLCTWCSTPALAGRTLCARHHADNLAASARAHAKRRQRTERAA